MVHVLNAEGDMLWSHVVNPLQWGDGVVPERVQGIAVLDSTRLAVLVSRESSEDDVSLDGIFELGLETQAVGWSALLEAPNVPPDSTQEFHPVTAKQVVTTESGALLVSGVGWAVDDNAPFDAWTTFWTQRLNPALGGQIWETSSATGSYSFGVINNRYRLVFHEASERLLLQGNGFAKPSGNCFWRELDLETGASIHPTDFTLGTHYEYCRAAKTFSDGTTATAVGFFAGNDEGHIHAAGPGGLAEYALDTTDFRGVHSMYIDADDTLYVTGALLELWEDAGAPLGFGRLNLEDPPNSEIFLTWETEAEYRELRAVAFGLGGEVLMLYHGPTGTHLEQLTVD